MMKIISIIFLLTILLPISCLKKLKSFEGHMEKIFVDDLNGRMTLIGTPKSSSTSHTIWTIAGNGSELWKKDMENVDLTSLAASNGHIFVSGVQLGFSGGDKNVIIYKIRQIDGQILSNLTFGGSVKAEISAMTAESNWLYAGGICDGSLEDTRSWTSSAEVRGFLVKVDLLRMKIVSSWTRYTDEYGFFPSKIMISNETTGVFVVYLKPGHAMLARYSDSGGYSIEANSSGTINSIDSSMANSGDILLLLTAKFLNSPSVKDNDSPDSDGKSFDLFLIGRQVSEKKNYIAKTLGQSYDEYSGSISVDRKSGNILVISQTFNNNSLFYVCMKNDGSITDYGMDNARAEKINLLGVSYHPILDRFLKLEKSAGKTDLWSFKTDLSDLRLIKEEPNGWHLPTMIGISVAILILLVFITFYNHKSSSIINSSVTDSNVSTNDVSSGKRQSKNISRSSTTSAGASALDSPILKIYSESLYSPSKSKKNPNRTRSKSVKYGDGGSSASSSQISRENSFALSSSINFESNTSTKNDLKYSNDASEIEIAMPKVPYGNLYKQGLLNLPGQSSFDYSSMEREMQDKIETNITGSMNYKKIYDDDIMTTTYTETYTEYTSTFSFLKRLLSGETNLPIPGFLECKQSSDYKFTKEYATYGAKSFQLIELVMGSELCMRSNNQRKAMIKPLDIRKARDENEVARFCREVGIMWSLRQCKSIAQIFGFSKDSLPTIILHYYENGTLRDVIKTLKSSLGGNSKTFLREKTSWLKQLTTAIKVLHESGFAHCKIKTTNILMQKDESNGGFIAALSDFESAQFLDQQLIAISNCFEVENIDDLDSASFAAPEVLHRLVNDSATMWNHEAKVKLWKSSDMFSFSMVGYEVLNENPPWSSETQLQSLISKVLSGERPRNMADVEQLRKKSSEVNVLCETIERCWNDDPYARLRIMWVNDILGQIFTDD